MLFDFNTEKEVQDTGKLDVYVSYDKVVLHVELAKSLCLFQLQTVSYRTLSCVTKVWLGGERSVCGFLQMIKTFPNIKSVIMSFLKVDKG